MKLELNLITLGIILAVLRFAGVIDWSWWWVTLPVWIFPAALLVLAAFTFILFLLATLVDGVKSVFG